MTEKRGWKHGTLQLIGNAIQKTWENMPSLETCINIWCLLWLWSFQSFPNLHTLSFRCSSRRRTKQTSKIHISWGLLSSFFYPLLMMQVCCDESSVSFESYLYNDTFEVISISAGFAIIGWTAAVSRYSLKMTYLKIN